MARQEQDMGGIPREGAPAQATGPYVPAGSQFADASPQATRTGTSPNPADQAKRGTPQMNNSGISSPAPENGQSRGSPNSAMNFNMGHMDPNMQHFNMAQAQAQAQMNGMRPPNGHPGQPFNAQMINAQMMARQGQQPGQPGANPQQWQQGPNGQMMPQGMPPNPQAQGTPQPRSMPPPSAPAAAGNNANAKTTASPQQGAAAPPTPNQTNKAAPKKGGKKANEKRAGQKKSNANLNAAAATPAADAAEQEPPTPATPITPAATGNFNKGGPNAPQAGAAIPAAAPPPPAVAVPQPGQPAPNQNGLIGMEPFIPDEFGMDLDPTMTTADVLNDFDFDSFLHDGDGGNEPFDFNGAFSGMENGEIGAE